MSSTLAPRRPQLLYQRSTSSSLNGMEKSIPKSSPISETSPTFIPLASINLRDKPLPPIPRRPSSTYSTHIDGTNVADRKLSENRTLPSYNVLRPTLYRSDVNTMPGTCSTRPKLANDLSVTVASYPIVERRRAQHVDFAKLSIHKSQSMSPNAAIFGSPVSSQHKNEKSNQIDNDRIRAADHHASNYQSVLHDKTTALPSLGPDLYFNHYSLPSPTSPRITDVVDQSLVPPPLRYGTPEEKSRQSSYFSSSSSSGVGTVHRSVRNSLKSYARKAFHLKSSSHEQTENPKAQHSKFSSKNLPSPRRESRTGSAVTQRRASILQGISKMYDNLADFTATSSTRKPSISIMSTKNKHISRERRSPAIPITPYQKLGRKALESGFKSPKTSIWSKSRQSESTRPNSLKYASEGHSKAERFRAPMEPRDPRPSSTANKILSTLQNGSEKEFAKESSRMGSIKAKSEIVRRQELKKKITVVGTGDQKFKKDDDWL